MPFKPGQSGNPSGKPVGAKSEKIKQWEELGEALLTRHSERANKILETMPDDKFLDNYGKLLEYFKPKQARTEVKQEGVQQVEVIIKRKGDADNP
jgi:hypothetical protein